MPERGGVQYIPRPSANRPGRSAPWAGVAPDQRRLSLEAMRGALAAAGPARRSPVEGAGVRASAVLVPLYEEAGEPRVVLTRRAQHLRSHRGEVSFPGGGQEPNEDLLTTALRESEEETGLDPEMVEIVGELDHLETVTSRSFIVPFVGVLPGRPELRPNPNEVELILHVPLGELLLDGVFREERWGLPPLDRPIYFFEVVGDTIWGATGSMLRNLLALATGTDWR
jgi:8-oxo-dGTP pyrophosphatase MutT (NUDIX family)